jgi:hypothetical protein
MRNELYTPDFKGLGQIADFRGSGQRRTRRHNPYKDTDAVTDDLG